MTSSSFDVVMVGLDRSGKSSVANALTSPCNTPLKEYRPTAAVSHLAFPPDIRIIDTPGQPSQRSRCWGSCLQGTQVKGMIACVDAMDHLRLALAWTEILGLSQRHPKVPLLVLFTYQDEPRALRVHEALDILGDFAPFPVGAKVHMFAVSSLTGYGIDEVRQWVCAL